MVIVSFVVGVGNLDPDIVHDVAIVGGAPGYVLAVRT